MSGEDGVSAEDLTALARAISQLANDAHRLAPPGGELASIVSDHLGVDAGSVPVVGQSLPVVERPNLQLAVEALVADQPAARLIGLSPEIGNFGGFSLQALLAGRFHGPSDPVPPVYDELPVDVDQTLACVTTGIWLLHYDGVPVAVAVVPGERHGPGPRLTRLEVFSPRREVSTAVVAELGRLRSELNVYRAKMLGFSFSEYGEFGVVFLSRPQIRARDVILPEGLLESIHRHTLATARHAEALRAAGRHLKRGLLLYGPPGAGKTHTVGHLVSEMPDRTVVVLQGPAMGALGQAVAIIRSLTPSMLVLEDIDLIATARDPHNSGTGPLLFQLLNEMDGLTPTDDVLFVLTTNRLDLLEPALVARPGRIDHAVHVDVPDPDGRRRLLELYLDGCDHHVDDLRDVVDRTDGVTASFFKELVRRAVLRALDDGGRPVNDDDLLAATDEMRASSEPVLAAMLGADTTERPTAGEGWSAV